MKKIIIMAAALLLGLQGMNAQTENEENDDIITVTDKDGKSEEIEIPESVNDIEMEAFVQCESLKKVIIKANVECIKTQTFAWCTSLKDIYIKKH